MVRVARPLAQRVRDRCHERAFTLTFDELGSHRVYATADPDNVASVKTLERAGFRLEGHHIDYVLTHRGWRDRLTYSLLADESARRRMQGGGS